jgi:hypothetical protein
MGGTKPLACKGFIESPSFEKSKHDLMVEMGMTARQDRLEGLVWALSKVDAVDESDAVVTQVPGRNLWVAVIPRGILPSMSTCENGLTGMKNASGSGLSGATGRPYSRHL